MNRLGSLFLLAALTPAGTQRPEVVPPEQGPLVVQSDLRLARGSYVRVPRSRDGLEPACVLRAAGLRDVTIDLRGVTLRGNAQTSDPDASSGYGLYLTDCERVTVVGGTLGGFRGCIVAERCRELRVEGVRFDGYFAQRLRSTVAAEHLDDWLRPHDNEGGEWLANYGAALSLSDCGDSVVSGCRARHGQNGLLLTRSTSARVFDNDFSFLSGWGIALYRSSDNVIARNRCDYCVRGYSEGHYGRGQDSAGILLFEGSCDNVVAENSASHGGDGLFLHAGEDLVAGRARADGAAPRGGCDRNLIHRNDFSSAVANGIEATFSRDNRVVENVAQDCLQHGLWGGYSSRMLIALNDFSGADQAGITIEHGQECWILRNVLERSQVGLELYWDEDPQFVDGPFGRAHDTSSRDHWILGNSFAANDADLAIDRTTGLAFRDNVFERSEADLFTSDLELVAGERSDETTPKQLLRGLVGFYPSGRLSASSVRVAPAAPPAEISAALEVELELPGTTRPFDSMRPGKRGSDSIVIGEWGPWDFESGEPRPTPRPNDGLFAGARWSTRWFSWANGSDPRGDDAAQAAWRAQAESSELRGEVSAWSDPWGGRDDVRAALGNDRFGLLASTTLELGGGRYELRVLSDDGVRVRVDGQVVLQNWTWHSATTDVARFELAPGAHAFELEYFQIDGGAALSLDLLR